MAEHMHLPVSAGRAGRMGQEWEEGLIFGRQPIPFSDRSSGGIGKTDI